MGFAITVGLAQAFSVVVAGLTGSTVPQLTKTVDLVEFGMVLCGSGPFTAHK